MSTTATDVLQRAIHAELERQRGAIDACRGLRAVEISVKLPPITGVPRLDARTVLLRLETEGAGHR